ncbi:3-deoxy-manno-octulosonate cytidylyltransferase [Candidatus Desantisbacteria bacterium]|nr:3-deoxy-manno-octulosonate cytidylyltransferase [Candidatus Desantisbacteria bacterium]
MKKKVVGVIPARYGSTRLPGKALILIHGKPMIQHVYEQCIKASRLEEVYVATDDKRIFDCVKGFGGKVVMTSPHHLSGTDRIREAAKHIKADIIVNIQGDEPLIVPEMIDQAVMPLVKNSKIYMSTLVKKIDNPLDLFNPSIAKVIIDNMDYAVYFSRSLVPYPRDAEKMTPEYFKKSGILKTSIFYKHIGLYVYTRRFLFKLTSLPPSLLEQTEKLEQLRVISNGFKIKAIETNFDTLGVDTPHELKIVKQIMVRNLDLNDTIKSKKINHRGRRD